MASTSSEPLHQEASRIELTLTAMIQELKRCSGPQGDIVSMNTQIRQLMSKLNAKIQSIQRQAGESKSQDDKESLSRSYEWHTTQYNEIEKSLRRANLAAKTAMDSHARRSLFEGATPVGQQPRGDSVQAASAATESLVSLRHRLSSELDQSKRSLDVLAQSSGQISDTDKEMENMGAYIQLSHRLVTKFGRREVADFLLIMCGVAFFFAVVLYILKKRTYG